MYVVIYYLGASKGEEMSFFRAIFLGFLLLSYAEGKEAFHIKGPFDLDKDNANECLILNGVDYSILFIEIISPNENDTLWSYNFESGISISDGDFVDLDNDGLMELVIIPNIISIDDSKPWLYVFNGLSMGFKNQPLVYSGAPLSLEALRPSSLTIINDPSSPIGVCFASPIRTGMIFDIEISGKQLQLINARLLSSLNNSNGYGVIQMSSFSSNNHDYIAIISSEEDSLHTEIFDTKDSYSLIQSKTIAFDGKPINLSTPIMPYSSKYNGKDGLLLPISSDGVFLLSILDTNILISTTNISKENAFPSKNQNNLESVLKFRENAVALKVVNTISKNISSKIEESNFPETDDGIYSDTENFKMKIIANDRNLTSIPKSKQKIFYKKEKNNFDQNKYNMLSPTLGDFLTDIKKDTKSSIKKDIKVSIPKANIDMESVNWADEAGFTYMDLGEYSIEKIDTVKSNPIPVLDTAIATFTDEAKQLLRTNFEDQDSVVNSSKINEIDLYYVLVMTPATQTRDRYIFDGEAPFGVAVNQIPPTGEATHFQHGVSANLANLTPGEKYDFAYSLRDATKDTITTFTMVHDLQTNVVLMSISPTADSVSQSYQPESFDPKLFEFPNYFFEGFPTSLDMDFTDKLIRFSFDGIEDSIYQGIYLSSTTPSNPPQSLAIFLDQGTIQSVKGEVVVRANGSKKITTQFDLAGSVEPSLMFSKLIQEAFPEELKIKLLQGASLEEPLFGPKGKLPKVIREPRLPEAQSALSQQDVPVSPKQSVVPDATTKKLESKNSNKAITVEPLESEITFPTLNVDQQKNQEDNNEIDSLKLEQSKTLLDSNLGKIPSDPEDNQSEFNNTGKEDE